MVRRIAAGADKNEKRFTPLMEEGAQIFLIGAKLPLSAAAFANAIQNCTRIRSFEADREGVTAFWACDRPEGKVELISDFEMADYRISRVYVGKPVKAPPVVYAPPLPSPLDAGVLNRLTEALTQNDQKTLKILFGSRTWVSTVRKTAPGPDNQIVDAEERGWTDFKQ